MGSLFSRCDAYRSCRSIRTFPHAISIKTARSTDSGISLEPPPPILEEFKDDLLDGYTDEQLYQYYLQSPNIITTEPEIVKILSRNLVTKPRAYNDDPKDEFLAIELAHKLGIMTPRVHRLVQFTTEEAKDSLIIMDRIHGLTLEQLWPTLSLWNTFRLAWQLRRYLRCMGSIITQTTGGLHTGLCNSPWFMDINGPTAHASPSTLRLHELVASQMRSILLASSP
ncbi:hypothetical protein BJ912DRAFT_188892 [Pholiota molesta]|nr:hypothetical protein BJ912DRAFT_188892 [Pholiota molesta]